MGFLAFIVLYANTDDIVVTRKRAAALLEKETSRDIDGGLDTDLGPPSRKRTKKQSQRRLPSHELEDSDDSLAGDVDTVKGLLNFNADTSSDQDDGEGDHAVEEEELLEIDEDRMEEEKGSDTGEDGRQKTATNKFVDADEVSTIACVRCGELT